MDVRCVLTLLVCSFGCRPASDVCEPLACEAKSCGPVADGCGDILQCGACESEMCGADSDCTCVPLECSVGQCGTVSDGCGGALHCGSCDGGSACDGGEECACVPVRCDERSCGELPDGCGGTVNCGTCAPDETCGAETPGVCGIDRLEVASMIHIGAEGSDGTNGASGDADGILIPWVTSSPSGSSLSWGVFQPAEMRVNALATRSPAADVFVARGTRRHFFLFGPSTALPFQNAGAAFHLTAVDPSSVEFAWSLPLGVDDAREARSLTASPSGDRGCVVGHPQGSGGRHNVTCAAEQDSSWTRYLENDGSAFRGAIVISAALLPDSSTLLLGGYALGAFEMDGIAVDAAAGDAVLLALEASTGRLRWSRVLTRGAPAAVLGLSRGVHPASFGVLIHLYPGATVAWAQREVQAGPGLNWNDGELVVLTGAMDATETSLFQAGDSNIVGAEFEVFDGRAIVVAHPNASCWRSEIRWIDSRGVSARRELRKTSCDNEPAMALVRSIHRGGQGEAILVGNFGGTLHLSTGDATANGDTDVFVISIDLKGGE